MTELLPCPFCDGTGWTSAAKETGTQNLPWQLQPLGVFPCRHCGGNGKQFSALLDEKDLATIRKALENIRHKETE